MEKEKIQVNEAMAELFYEQCVGQYNGHMSAIPNNPTLMSICKACGVKDKKDFKEFLLKLSENINDSNPF